MPENFGFQPNEINPKVRESFLNRLPIGKIQLPDHGCRGDILTLVMRFFHYFKASSFLVIFTLMNGWNPAEAQETPPADKNAKPAAETVEKKPEEQPKKEEPAKEEEKDDELSAEEADAAAVAKPVTADPVQVYGWREKISVEGVKDSLNAKLDTGAFTSSIHAEEKELFEREGKKWVRFIVTDPSVKDSPRIRLEAPLVRIARIKDPGGKSQSREVVKLTFKIGERKLRGDFTLNNRSNMLSPVLIGRTVIKELGWVDSTRTNIADQKIMR